MTFSAPCHEYQERAVERMTSMLAYWSDQLVCKFANRAYERWFGVRPESLIGTSIQELLGPELFAQNELYIRRALAGEEQVFERIVPGPNGTQRHSIARYLPDVVEGRVLGFIAEVTEVTPLKEAQEALESEIAARQRVTGLLLKKDAALETAQRLGRIGSWHWEIQADIVTWSAELYRIFGRDPSKLPPGYAEQDKLYTPTSWRKLGTAVERCIAGGPPYVLELEYRKTDGSTGWLESRGEPEFDSHGFVVGLHGTAQEISERRQLLALVEKHYASISLATEVSGLALWQWEPVEDELIWENGRLCEIFGLPAGRAPINARTFRSEVLHPDDDAAFALAMQQTVEAGDDLWFVGRIRRRTDGKLRWIEIRGKPRGTPSGVVVFGVIADVTERIGTEQALKRIADDYAELDRRKTDLLAVLGHELRNCLAPLQSGLKALRMAGSAGDGTRMHDLMGRQLAHMTRLVDDLYDLRRVNSGELDLQRRTIDLRTVVAAAVEMSQPLIDRSAHSLAVVLDEEELLVDGDPIRLAQVVSNLLNNAAKFTPSGGSIQVVLGCGLGGFAELDVVDNGVGMTPAEAEAVFGLYVQSGPAAQRADGLGIGLYLVRRLVELHGGSVEAASPGPGKGSTFSLRLPLRPGSAGAGEARR